MGHSDSASTPNLWLRHFSKLTTFATLLLIFVGGMVTSTGSGLSVPDWPLSYGMLFPPMVGGVFYEHGHRMVASLIGLLMLILAIGLGKTERRSWVKTLGFYALGAVIAQGILGGLTVKLFLPPPVSIAHGVLAQTFFILTIIIAYSQSAERSNRLGRVEKVQRDLLRVSLMLTAAIYLQLIVGAIMRHTHSGLAIPDFPTMGGHFFPHFDLETLRKINLWRFDNNLDPVTMGQVHIHFLHRLMALIVLILTGILGYRFIQRSCDQEKVKGTIFWLINLIWLQVILGILTVMTQKAPIVTSLHVMTGAASLGLSTLLVLRAAPLTFKEFKANL